MSQYFKSGTYTLMCESIAMKLSIKQCHFKGNTTVLKLCFAKSPEIKRAFMSLVSNIIEMQFYNLIPSQSVSALE